MKQTNNVYIYNNSFLSLLVLCQKLFLLKEKPQNITDNTYQLTIFDNNIINLNLPENDEIINYFITKTSSQIIRTCYYIFISCEKDKELIIFYFLLNAIKYRQKLYYMRNLNCVVKALKISKQVSNEVHKFKGFTRFKEISSHILSAEIAPDNDILYLLSNHFSKRLKNEYWIIQDRKRNKLSIYNKSAFIIKENTSINIENFINKEEQKNISMWKSFYKAIGIEERTNERCRMNHMPKKYWKYIIEMENENEKNY